MKLLIKITTIIISLLCAIYVYAFSQLNEYESFNKQSVRGDYAKLSDGDVFYKWFGENNKEITILIHGMSAPSIIWHKTIPALTDAGQKVLIYDLFGRGYSDKPDTIYNESFYSKQLLELLNYLQIDKKVNLVGFSLGGAIATSFTKQYEEKVNKLALIAPSGLVEKYPFLAHAAKIPIVGDWLAVVYLPWALRRKIDVAIKEETLPRELLVEFKKQYQYRGTLNAILSTVRHFPHGSMHETYAQVGKSSIPQIAIWGKDDKKMPFEYSTFLIQLMPNLTFYEVRKIGHSIVYERPLTVNKYLTDFLNINPGSNSKPKQYQ